MSIRSGAPSPDRTTEIVRALGMAAVILTLGAHVVGASNNGMAVSPPLGWSSWSSFQTDIDEHSVRAIADVQATTLKSAGYLYVNIDGGWYANPDLAVDAYGRWVADSTKFPSGMSALGDYIHGLGLKFGLYVTPGIPMLAVAQNTPIEGTPYHASDIAITSRTEVTYLGGTMYSIDYAAPGARDFIDSWANLFASWGVDYLKLDGVGTWNVSDIQAWSAALSRTSRPIHLQLANNLDPSYWWVWSAYANGWRISTDIEAYNGVTLTSWDRVASRFAMVPDWLRAGAAGGWNDLDSLDVGGANTGLTHDERQTMVTLWALSASPLIIGDDLRTLDTVGISLLTNTEVINVDQTGTVAAPLNASTLRQVWAAIQPDGSYAVGLFNLAESPATVEVSWSSLGFAGVARVRDLWDHLDLGSFSGTFSAPLNPHASMMLRVTPIAPAQQRLASTGWPSLWAFVGTSRVSPGGQRAHYVGYGSEITFANVTVITGGEYDLTINYVNGDQAPRTAVVTVNDRPFQVVFPEAGDWGADATNQGITTTAVLVPGGNAVTISNPTGWAPDIISISVQPRSSSGPVYYKLVSAFNGGVVDNPFGSAVAGTPIVQWFDHGGSNQQWQMMTDVTGACRLVNRLSGYALEAQASVTGWSVVQRPLGATSSQLWRPVAAGRNRYVLVNQGNGLIVHASPIWPGVLIDQQPSNGALDQQWVVVPVM